MFLPLHRTSTTRRALASLLSLSLLRSNRTLLRNLTREEEKYGVAQKRLTGHSHYVQDVAISSVRTQHTSESEAACKLAMGLALMSLACLVSLSTALHFFRMDSSLCPDRGMLPSACGTSTPESAHNTHSGVTRRVQQPCCCVCCRFLTVFFFASVSCQVTTRRFIGHSKDVLSVAFSADNRQ